MIQIFPRNDYVLIERIPENLTEIIVIPEAFRPKSIKGKVLAVGPGKWIEGVNGNFVRRTPEVKAGDTVYFNSKWNDDEQLTDGLHLVREADIFGVILDA